MENGNIQIMEKPEWVSWDDVHNVLWASHKDNRVKGINMRKPGLPGVEIQKEVEPNGKMLVAIDQDHLVGTAAIIFKEGNNWYHKGRYGYLCYASLLQDYQGKGLYGQLMKQREMLAKEANVDLLCFDTHCKNRNVIELNSKKGFYPVAIKVCSDHFNVIMAKWLNGCPYSNCQIKAHYWSSWLKVHLCYKKGRDGSLKHRAIIRFAFQCRSLLRNIQTPKCN